MSCTYQAGFPSGPKTQTFFAPLGLHLPHRIAGGFRIGANLLFHRLDHLAENRILIGEAGLFRRVDFLSREWA